MLIVSRADVIRGIPSARETTLFIGAGRLAKLAWSCSNAAGPLGAYKSIAGQAVVLQVSPAVPVGPKFSRGDGSLLALVRQAQEKLI